ncbi:hypothetical protein [Bradyrhizobium valentinum]|uniref:Uncharacterized protein n=1 Tax=Bradyrhizobium valentinum TaxID=1518501 RepID=A0A0R3M979_9BRAD|nr:hypothetical protein [Bradyrhizobium valentinum]KRR14533.1 hypothetical protein CP49_25820 [Bradyrhizobium valentinum]
MLTRPPARRRQRNDKRERRRLAQQRYRANKQNHVVVAPVKVGELMLNYLVHVVHWLDEADADDARKIGEAIARGLTEAAEAKR